MFIIFLNLILAVIYTFYFLKEYTNPVFYFIFIVNIVNIIYILKILSEKNRLVEELDDKYITASVMRSNSIIDPLTQIYNRRYFDDIFNKFYSAGKGNKQFDFSLMIIDIDHFKRFNDTYGHDVGDEVLKTVVNIIKNNLRKNDVFCRFGGEEFVILSEDSKEGAIKLAQKINKLEYESVEKITISIGVSFFNKGKTMDEMIKEADENLYKAKENGRNQVVYIYIYI
jgi:diguanylate cyclase (GGDEF)-like protein